MSAPLALIGVPSSAGAFAPGQERAPEALRAAGLKEKLGATGFEVTDRGDSAPFRWRPDSASPHAQNADAVRAAALDTAARVEQSIAAGELALVLGGDCTIELGTVAGSERSVGRTGLVYFDVHPDLNVPAESAPGALDWMGCAHMLGVEGAVPELVRLDGHAPLLRPDDILFFAYGPEQATQFEREQLELLDPRRVPVDRVASDPEGEAERAVSEFAPGFDRLLVHFDVDTIDFTDAPLSENPGRNEGLPMDAAMAALRVLVGADTLAALTVTELNPLHGAEDGSTVERFVDALVECLRPAACRTCGSSPPS